MQEVKGMFHLFTKASKSIRKISNLMIQIAYFSILSVFASAMPKSLQLARQIRHFLGVDPVALTGVSSRVSSRQKSALKLGEVGHVIAEE